MQMTGFKPGVRMDAFAATCAVGAGFSCAAVKTFLSGGPAGALTEPGTLAFGVGVCAAAALFGLAAAAVIAFAHALEGAPQVGAARVLSWNRTGSVLLVLACVAALAQPMLGLTQWPVAAAVGAVGGLGVLALAMSWGALFCCDEPLPSLAVAAVAFAIGQVVDAIAALALDPGMHYASVTVFAALGNLLFATAFAHRPQCSRSEHAEESLDFDAVRAQIVSAAKMLWMPLAGAALMVFIFGLTWDPVISGEDRFGVVEHLGAFRMMGGLLGAAAVFAFAAPGGGSSRLRMMHGTLLPAAVAIILALPVVEVAEESAVSLAFQVLQYAGFAIIQLSVWSAMMATARGLRLHPAAVFAASVSVFAVAGLLGLVVIHAIGLGGKDLCVVLLAVYMALIAASFALETRIERTARVADEVRPEAFIRRRCEELRESFGISPREVEVLFYLGRGYSHTYIARKLFVSENTVRTHVRHIYAKLGVGTREELLDLIDADVVGR